MTTDNLLRAAKAALPKLDKLKRIMASIGVDLGTSQWVEDFRAAIAKAEAPVDHDPGRECLLCGAAVPSGARYAHAHGTGICTPAKAEAAPAPASDREQAIEAWRNTAWVTVQELRQEATVPVQISKHPGYVLPNVRLATMLDEAVALMRSAPQAPDAVREDRDAVAELRRKVEAQRAHIKSLDRVLADLKSSGHLRSGELRKHRRHMRTLFEAKEHQLREQGRIIGSLRARLAEAQRPDVEADAAIQELVEAVGAARAAEVASHNADGDLATDAAVAAMREQAARDAIRAILIRRAAETVPAPDETDSEGIAEVRAELLRELHGIRVMAEEFGWTATGSIEEWLRERLKPDAGHAARIEAWQKQCEQMLRVTPLDYLSVCGALHVANALMRSAPQAAEPAPPAPVTDAEIEAAIDELCEASYATADALSEGDQKLAEAETTERRLEAALRALFARRVAEARTEALREARQFVKKRGKRAEHAAQSADSADTGYWRGSIDAFQWAIDEIDTMIARGAGGQS